MALVQNTATNSDLKYLAYNALAAYQVEGRYVFDQQQRILLLNHHAQPESIHAALEAMPQEARLNLEANVGASCKTLRDTLVNQLWQIYKNYYITHKEKLPPQWVSLHFEVKDLIDDTNYCRQVKYPAFKNNMYDTLLTKTNPIYSLCQLNNYCIRNCTRDYEHNTKLKNKDMNYAQGQEVEEGSDANLSSHSQNHRDEDGSGNGDGGDRKVRSSETSMEWLSSSNTSSSPKANLDNNQDGKDKDMYFVRNLNDQSNVDEIESEMENNPLRTTSNKNSIKHKVSKFENFNENGKKEKIDNQNLIENSSNTKNLKKSIINNPIIISFNETKNSKCYLYDKENLDKSPSVICNFVCSDPYSLNETFSYKKLGSNAEDLKTMSKLGSLLSYRNTLTNHVDLDLDLTKNNQSSQLITESREYYGHVDNRVQQLQNQSCLDTSIDPLQCYTQLHHSIYVLMHQFFGLNGDFIKLILLKYADLRDVYFSPIQSVLFYPFKDAQSDPDSAIKWIFDAKLKYLSSQSLAPVESTYLARRVMRIRAYMTSIWLHKKKTPMSDPTYYDPLNKLKPLCESHCTLNKATFPYSCELKPRFSALLQDPNCDSYNDDCADINLFFHSLCNYYCVFFPRPKNAETDFASYFDERFKYEASTQCYDAAYYKVEHLTNTILNFSRIVEFYLKIGHMERGDQNEGTFTEKDRSYFQQSDLKIVYYDKVAGFSTKSQRIATETFEEEYKKVIDADNM